MILFLKVALSEYNWETWWNCSCEPQGRWVGAWRIPVMLNKRKAHFTLNRRKDFNPNQQWSNDAYAPCYSCPFWATMLAIISQYLKYTNNSLWKRQNFLFSSEMFLSNLVVSLWCSLIMQLNLFLCVFINFILFCRKI